MNKNEASSPTHLHLLSTCRLDPEEDFSDKNKNENETTPPTHLHPISTYRPDQEEDFSDKI